MLGWYQKLESKPVRKSPEELEADAWIVSERARLRAEAAEREAREQTEREAAVAATPTRSSVARYMAVKDQIAAADGDRHAEWRLLTGDKTASTF